MPRVLELCDDLAERFNYEPTKVAGYARVLREAGHLTSGARGVNAPPATALDAANILIVMMLRSKLADAVADLKLVGAFVPGSNPDFSEGFKPENFTTGFAQIIQYLGRYDISECGFENSQYRKFSASIMIERDTMISSIRIREPHPKTRRIHKNEIFFAHPDVQRWLDDPAKIENFPLELSKGFERFKSGFHEAPALNTLDLLSVGQIVAGHLPVGWKWR